MLAEAGVSATVIRYPTGIAALQTWREHPSGQPEIIVVADLLPMLTLADFVDAARTIHRDVPLIVAGEPLIHERLLIPDVPCLRKPLSNADARLLQQAALRRRTHQRGMGTPWTHSPHPLLQHTVYLEKFACR
jgi:hypothetical protein